MGDAPNPWLREYTIYGSPPEVTPSLSPKRLYHLLSYRARLTLQLRLSSYAIAGASCGFDLNNKMPNFEFITII